jgi:ankyrin repeat protein
LDVVKTLIEHGARVDAATTDGATPLYIACQNGQIEVVKYLIEKGANVMQKVYFHFHSYFHFHLFYFFFFIFF